MVIGLLIPISGGIYYFTQKKNEAGTSKENSKSSGKGDDLSSKDPRYNVKKLKKLPPQIRYSEGIKFMGVQMSVDNTPYKDVPCYSAATPKPFGHLKLFNEIFIIFCRKGKGEGIYLRHLRAGRELHPKDELKELRLTRQRKVGLQRIDDRAWIARELDSFEDEIEDTKTETLELRVVTSRLSSTKFDPKDDTAPLEPQCEKLFGFKYTWDKLEGILTQAESEIDWNAYPYIPKPVTHKECHKKYL
jgi:hypothetical protein